MILLLGIGSPPGQMDPKAFLLQKFNAVARDRVSLLTPILILFSGLFEDLFSQQMVNSSLSQAWDAFYRVVTRLLVHWIMMFGFFFVKIDAALPEGVEVLKLLLSKGLTESARHFNTQQKYKHIRLQTLQTWISGTLWLSQEERAREFLDNINERSYRI